MKAIQIHKHGGPEVLEVHDGPTPSPGPGQVLVRLEAAGLNFIDTYQREGAYKVDLPYTPGLEGAGEVAEVGDGVETVKPGDRVAYTSTPGSYAEYVVVSADKLVEVPSGVDTKLAAAVMLQGMTAHYLAFDTYALKPGDTCLIHAVAGGVGLLLTQIAKLQGATVIGTTSTEEKAERARQMGADHVILYTQEDFETRTRELTGSDGVPVVYDSVGKTTFAKSLNCLAPRGYLVLFGQSSGPVGDIDPQVLNAKGSLFLTRPSLFHYIAKRAELEKRAHDLFGWIKEDKLTVHVDSEMGLEHAPDAHRKLEGRHTSGKVLLIP